MASRINRRSLFHASVIAFAMHAAFPANAITYDLVPVGNPGNTADVTGYGSVPYDYQIGKYLVTISQYTAFLNSVAKTDPYSLYNGVLGSWGNIAGISRTGAPGSYTYSVVNNAGDSSNRPITYVSWFDAARFANWMANGQPVGPPSSTTTEDGTYRLNGIMSGNVVAKNGVNPNTRSLPAFSIPTENEWYKAAYYSPNFGGVGVQGYYLYGTQSNTAPGNEVGSKPNQANYNNGVFSVTQVSTYSASQNYLTDVGAFSASRSFYGVYDLSGNVNQWNDLDGSAGSSRGVRGGVWDNYASAMIATHRGVISPADEGYYNGVRLAATSSQSVIINVDTSLVQRTQSELGRVLLTGSTPVIKAGYGTLVLDAANTFTGPMSINQGTLLATNSAALQATPITVQAGGMLRINTVGTMQAPSLTLTGSSQAILPTAIRQIVSLGSLSVDQAAGGRIDIGKGRIEIAPGGISEADLRADLIAGRGVGTFSGTNPGIVTSAANPSPLMAPVIGYNILPSGAAIVAWSAFGDLNLDGSVDFDDVVQFVSAGRYDTGLPANWAQGDFDYNGVVDFDDIVAFTGSRLYDKGSYLPSPQAPSGMVAFGGESLGIAAVPEPSTWVMVAGGIACASWSAWRRRKQA